MDNVMMKLKKKIRKDKVSSLWFFCGKWQRKKHRDIEKRGIFFKKNTEKRFLFLVLI